MNAHAGSTGNGADSDTDSQPIELDYSAPDSDDYASLARDAVPVRSLQRTDFDAIARIDQHITHHDRREYLRRKIAEVLDEAGVRVSLVAEIDGQAVGFRKGLGSIGRHDT